MYMVFWKILGHADRWRVRVEWVEQKAIDSFQTLWATYRPDALVLTKVTNRADGEHLLNIEGIGTDLYFISGSKNGIKVLGDMEVLMMKGCETCEGWYPLWSL